MAITLSFSIESPRGPVDITADITGLSFCDTKKEIEQFFDGVLLLKNRIYELKKQEDEISNPAPVVIPAYNEAITCDPIMVIS